MRAARVHPRVPLKGSICGPGGVTGTCLRSPLDSTHGCDTRSPRQGLLWKGLPRGLRNLAPQGGSEYTFHNSSQLQSFYIHRAVAQQQTQ